MYCTASVGISLRYHEQNGLQEPACHDSEYAFFVGMKSQTYIAASVLQVLSWQGSDNGECSQSREDSEERETHCD